MLQAQAWVWSVPFLSNPCIVPTASLPGLHAGLWMDCEVALFGSNSDFDQSKANTKEFRVLAYGHPL